MKLPTRKSLLAVCLLRHLAGTLSADTITGNLEVGVSNHFVDWACGAFGFENALFGNGAVAIGMGNHAEEFSLSVGSNSSAYYSALTVGTYNNAYYSSVAFGEGNNVDGLSLALGRYNYCSGGDSSIAIGLSNNLWASSYSIAVGNNNVMSSATNGAVIGEGLVNYISRNSTIIGQYNQYLYTQPLFVVGNGTLEQRNNAFVVHRNGSVTISKRQGDILMGEFGN